MNIKEMIYLPQKNIGPDVSVSTPLIEFYPANTLDNYRVVNMLARYKNQWLYSRAKTRDVFEMPGGCVEPGETALEAAKRELYEETGAMEYDIEPAFDFKGLMPHGEVWNGQTFYVQIHTLGEMPDYEMAEVGLCGGIPDKARFPDILEAIFRKMQSWLNLQGAKDELWDVYDVNRVKTGRLHRRGRELPAGDYHLSVLILLQNTRGEYLITKRAPEKGYAGMWENSGGAAQSGDDSLTAAVRELREETGIGVSPEDGVLEFTSITKDTFFDVWKFIKDFQLSDVVLQEKETVDARFASLEEIIRLIDAGAFLAGPDLVQYFTSRQRQYGLRS